MLRNTEWRTWTWCLRKTGTKHLPKVFLEASTKPPIACRDRPRSFPCRVTPFLSTPPVPSLPCLSKAKSFIRVLAHWKRRFTRTRLPRIAPYHTSTRVSPSFYLLPFSPHLTPTRRHHIRQQIHMVLSDSILNRSAVIEWTHHVHSVCYLPSRVEPRQADSQS